MATASATSCRPRTTYHCPASKSRFALNFGCSDRRGSDPLPVPQKAAASRRKKSRLADKPVTADDLTLPRIVHANLNIYLLALFWCNFRGRCASPTVIMGCFATKFSENDKQTLIMKRFTSTPVSSCPRGPEVTLVVRISSNVSIRGHHHHCHPRQIMSCLC